MPDGRVEYEVRANLSKLDGDLNQANTMAEKGGGKLGGIAKTAGLAIGTAFVAGSAAVIKFGSDFEAIMSGVAAVSGASEAEMEALSQAAIDAGAKTSFSASESAQAIEELIKAGLTTEQILGGGLAGALDLAAAGELEVAEAATIASTALNAFKSENLSVTDAANIMAGAANASAADVRDLQMGMSQVSAVASGMGFTFEDTATALAAFAQNGLKGSDAGTSLKTMLMNLQPMTKKQSEMFKELGLLTANGTSAFYDQNGKMKSLKDISGLLQKSLKGLTDQQRAQALEVMFGSDAIRAGNILYKEGAKGIEEMADAMGKVSAADVAAKRLDNFKGDLEALMGSLETIAIELYMQIQPLLDEAMPLLIDLINELGPSIGELVTGLMPPLIDLFKGLIPPILEIIEKLLPVLIDLVETLLPPIIKLVDALLPPLIQLIDALLPILDIVISLLGPILDLFVELLQPIIDLISGAITPLINALQPLIEIWLKGLSSALEVLMGVFKDVFGTVSGYVQDHVQRIIDTFKNIIDFIKNVFTGNWKGAWENVKSIFKNIADGIAAAFKLPINLIIDGINGFIGGLNKIKIPNWVPGVGGKGFHLDKIPKLKVGMEYVPSDDFPAFLHKGEMVLPAPEASILRSLGGIDGVTGLLSAPFLAAGGGLAPASAPPTQIIVEPSGSGQPQTILLESYTEIDGMTVARSTSKYYVEFGKQSGQDPIPFK